MSEQPDLRQILSQQAQILDELRDLRSRMDNLEARRTKLEARFSTYITAVETRLGVR